MRKESILFLFPKRPSGGAKENTSQKQKIPHFHAIAEKCGTRLKIQKRKPPYCERSDQKGSA